MDENYVYEGEFENNRKHGMGKLKFNNNQDSTNNNQYYVGQFVDDLYDGKGQIVYANNDVYNGEFR